MPYIGQNVALYGPYAASNDGNPVNTAACGWGGLTIGNIIYGARCPYRIDHNGIPIGWAPPTSII